MRWLLVLGFFFPIALACQQDTVTLAPGHSVLILAPDSTGVDTVPPDSGGASDTTVAGGCPTSYTRLVNVSTAAQLAAAISAALPGDLIQMAPGTYTGKRTITRSGTADKPIALCGPRTAVIAYTSLSSGWVMNLQASYWVLHGFSVTNGIAGVHITGGSYNVLDSLNVHDVGQEAIKVAEFSSHNILRNNWIHDTGKYKPGFGEGTYIGTADSQWDTATNGQPDKSDSNQVLNNTYGPNVKSENVDAKPGTTGGLIQGNTFNCAGESPDNTNAACIGIKGNNYTFQGNTLTGSIKHGFDVVVLVQGWGNNTLFTGNTVNNIPGYGFHVGSTATGTKVKCDNTVTNAALGFSNVQCVP